MPSPADPGCPPARLLSATLTSCPLAPRVSRAGHCVAGPEAQSPAGSQSALLPPHPVYLTWPSSFPFCFHFNNLRAISFLVWTLVPLQMACSLHPPLPGSWAKPQAEGGRARQRVVDGQKGTGSRVCKKAGLRQAEGWFHQTRLGGHNYAVSTYLDCESTVNSDFFNHPRRKADL